MPPFLSKGYILWSHPSIETEIPPPEKVAAFCDWTEAMNRTPKQMKGLLGVCNW